MKAKDCFVLACGTAAFTAVRNATLPADIAISPSVPKHLEAAGFKVLNCRPYTLDRVRRITTREFFDLARRTAEITALRRVS